MAREGLRTLVFGMRKMSDAEFDAFNKKYTKAKAEIVDRDAKTQRVIEEIEKGLELIGLTGVEDKLQEKVKPTLEMLRNAGTPLMHIHLLHSHLSLLVTSAALLHFEFAHNISFIPISFPLHAPLMHHSCTIYFHIFISYASQV